LDHTSVFLGADILSQEWPEHVAALLADGKITAEQAAQCPELRLVGFTGTIDNDMAGTDATIGIFFNSGVA
jgi:6-phosphofructokinase 1